MRANKRHEPGHLFRLLEQKAATDGFTREALVNRLGISYPHYFAMRSDPAVSAARFCSGNNEPSASAIAGRSFMSRGTISQ